MCHIMSSFKLDVNFVSAHSENDSFLSLILLMISSLSKHRLRNSCSPPNVNKLCLSNECVSCESSTVL